jgi:hypothetical protein
MGQRSCAGPSPTDKVLLDLWSEAEGSIEVQWTVAQGICGFAKPEVQGALDKSRRECLAYAARSRDDPKGLGPGRPRRFARWTKVQTIIKSATKWQDFVFSPELDRDDVLNGALIPRGEVVRLKINLTAQHRVVKRWLQRRAATPSSAAG